MLRDEQVPVIGGLNMGITWSKKTCALFLLSHGLGGEIITLREDDTQPNRAGWEAKWIRGSVAAQCSSFSLTVGAWLFTQA
jgi:hypothetical protein